MNKDSQTLTIGSYPTNGGGNPYIDLFYGSLNELGFTKKPTISLFDNGFEDSLEDLDIIHVHWLGPYYDNPSLLYTFKGALALIKKFRVIKKRKKKLIFTCHNLKSHECRSKLIDDFVRFMTIQYADVVVAHSKSAQEKIKKRFLKSKNVINIPHGHYIDSYLNKITPQQAKEQFGIKPNEKVFLFFGNIRPYKGLEILIRSFKESKIENAKLLIAGKPNTPEYTNEIQELIGGDDNIISDFRFIEDDQVQDYFNAADVCVFPFDKILTSGSMLLALSFGLPVVIPNVDSIVEYTSDDVALTFENGALSEALCVANEKLNHGWGKRELVIDWARQFDWQKSADVFSKTIKDLYQ